MRYQVTSNPELEVSVLTAGLACCTLEIEAAVSAGYLVAVDPVGEPDIVVIAGTVTDALVPALRAQLDQFPHTRIMSFGACATSGGPYWDSPPVTKGIDQYVGVDTYVAGCPPRPEAFISALVQLATVPAS